MELSPLVCRIQSEFREMPDLQLTLPQAARLWGLEIEACEQVVAQLVEQAFLRWTDQRTIVRAAS